MVPALSPRALDRIVPMLAGATVVAVAAGSSSVADVKELGLHARWVVLAALAAAAAAWVVDARRLPAPVLAAAGAYVALALVSSLWSVAPRLSAARALSLALLFAAAVGIAAGVRAVPERAGRVLLGLLGGAVAVAALGVLLLAFSYDTAVEPASIEAPPRFRGFGEDPNTVPLLLALALPVALAWGLAARHAVVRGAAVAALLLFAGTIVGSGSRGALLGAAVGVAVTTAFLLRGRRLALGALAVCVSVALAALLQTLPNEAEAAPPAPPAAAETASRYVDGERVYPLDNDVGRPLPGGGEPPVERSFFGTSGRTDAWEGALERVVERPLLGFGFGTEARAFVDRYYGFVGGLPESSYIGIALQLGVVGLAGLLALLALLAVTGRRAVLRRASPWPAACAGAVGAGLAVAAVQSYLYSVGNIATATFWTAAFLLPALATAEGPA